VHCRRPLSGHADLLRRAADRESVRAADLRESVDAILQAATGGAETVKRLLTFAPTNPEAETRQVNLDTLLREVAQLTAPRWRDATQAEGRPISLHVESAGNVSICGQPASLREALTNLVFNAVDALPRGGTICLRAERHGDHVAVEVADTGIGSPAGPGPLSQEDDATSTVLLQGVRVLAVDDEPALGRMLALMLNEQGHKTVVATSAEEALDRLAAEPFDLLLTDIGMGPGMNGWELAEQVRQRWPAVRLVFGYWLGGGNRAADCREPRDRGRHLQAVPRRRHPSPSHASSLGRSLTRGKLVRPAFHSPY